MKKILLNTLFCVSVLTTQHSVAQMGVPRCNESLWKDDYSSHANCNLILDSACIALNGAKLTPDFEAAYATLLSAVSCDSTATGSPNEFFSMQLRKIRRYIDQVKEIDSLNGKQPEHTDKTIVPAAEAQSAAVVGTQAIPGEGTSGSPSQAKVEETTSPSEITAGSETNGRAGQQDPPSQSVPDAKENVQKSGEASGSSGGAVTTGVLVVGAVGATSSEKTKTEVTQDDPITQTGMSENKNASETSATVAKDPEESKPATDIKQNETTESAVPASIAAVAVVQADTQAGEGKKPEGGETGSATSPTGVSGSSDSSTPVKATETSQAAVAMAPVVSITAEQKSSSIENKKATDIKVLTQEEQQEYQVKGLAKVHELEGYLKLVASKTTASSLSNDAIVNAMKLFYDVEERFIQVSSLNNPEKPKFSVRRYFERLRLLNYEQVEIEWVNFQYTSDFLKGEDGLFHGYVEFQQTFTATRDNRIVYSDLTTKKEEIILVQYKKAFEGVETEGFDVFLGDMSVVQTSTR